MQNEMQVVSNDLLNMYSLCVYYVTFWLYPMPTKFRGGGGILVSLCPSVCPSICPSIRLLNESCLLCIFHNIHLNLILLSTNGLNHLRSNCLVIIWDELMCKHLLIVDDDIMKWKHFLRYRPFVRGIHRSLVDSLHWGQWCRALMFSLVCVWTNCWTNSQKAGELRCLGAHFMLL